MEDRSRHISETIRRICRLKPESARRIAGAVWAPLLVVAVGSLARVELFRDVPPALAADSPSYILPARSLLESGDIVSRHRPPLYPLFIAAIYAFAGLENHRAVVLVQHLLGLLAALVFLRLLTRITGRKWLGLGMALLLALNYKVISYERIVLTESLAVLLVGALSLALTEYFSSQRTDRYGLLGGIVVLQSMMLLLRPFFLFLPALVCPGLALHWYLRGLRGKRLAGTAATFLGLSLLPIIGWQAVQYATYGHYRFSAIGNINLVGKVAQLRQYRFAPEEHQATTDVFEGHPDVSNPYDLLPLFAVEEDPDERLHELGDYCAAAIWGAPWHFFRGNAKLLPYVLSSDVYPSAGAPSKSRARPVSRVIDRLNRFPSRPMTGKYLLLVVAVVLFTVAGPWKKGLSRQFWWKNAALALLVAYALAISTFAGYTDYGRLMIPVAPLVQYFRIAFVLCLAVNYVTYKIDQRGDRGTVGGPAELHQDSSPSS